jgi:hypothetical protein
MKATQKATQLLEEMGKIQRMERGKICKMKGREHFNHQTWQHGRNQVRYVPREEIEDLQQAIDGYARFTKLAQQYAEQIIRLTRREHARRHPRQPRRTTTSSSARKKSPPKRPD